MGWSGLATYRQKSRKRLDLARRLCGDFYKVNSLSDDELRRFNSNIRNFSYVPVFGITDSPSPVIQKISSEDPVAKKLILMAEGLLGNQQRHTQDQFDSIRREVASLLNLIVKRTMQEADYHALLERDFSFEDYQDQYLERLGEFNRWSYRRDDTIASSGGFDYHIYPDDEKLAREVNYFWFLPMKGGDSSKRRDGLVSRIKRALVG